MRVAQNSFDDGVNLVQEVCPKPVLFLLVVPCRFFQLRKGRRCESVLRHFLRDERRSRSADGPSTADNSPCSKASMRSSDSAAHFASTSLCATHRGFPRADRSTSLVPL